MILPQTRVANAEVRRPSTASIAALSSSISITVLLRLNRSCSEVACSAPMSTRGSHFSGVRFQTVTGIPARSRLRAIGSPM